MVRGIVNRGGCWCRNGGTKKCSGHSALVLCAVKRVAEKEGGAVEFAKESGGSEGSGRVGKGV
jgi:hypothetical protein